MKVLCWNMGAGFGFKGAKHAAAWEWLNTQDADVAMLQEVVPRDEFVNVWSSVAFTHKYQNWGSAVLVRDGVRDGGPTGSIGRVPAYEQVHPTGDQPWLSLLGGAVAIARSVDPASNAPWFASIHSDASSIDATARKYPSMFTEQPPRDGIARASATEMWEIEAIAHELAPLLEGRRFLLGGDLNASLSYDAPGEETEAQIFENLASLGLVDIRHRHSAIEVRTWFPPGATDTSSGGPVMLDHLYADQDTEASIISWRVLSEVAADLGLSDHAPIEVVFGARGNG